MHLYFVTSNENKVKEAEAILKVKINKANLDIKEIQEIEVDEVVKDKAIKAYYNIKKPVFVEDTGFYIEAWKGFPGALIKWVLKTLGNEGICKLLKNDRSVVVKTSVSIYNGKECKNFTGKIKGSIPNYPKGTSGFGWDPIFQPDKYNKTFAEMTQDEKNKISMRKIALLKMKEFLDNNPEFLNTN